MNGIKGIIKQRVIQSLTLSSPWILPRGLRLLDGTGRMSGARWYGVRGSGAWSERCVAPVPWRPGEGEELGGPSQTKALQPLSWG